VAGRLASYVGRFAEVTLKSPPPLDTPLTVVHRDGAVELLDQDRLLAVARAATPVRHVLPAVDQADAAAAAGRTFAASAHPVPGCFVCGPARRAGDGLRIHVGPLDPDDHDWTGALAAPWVPAAELADAHGRVRAEFIWAALDCPTAYACSTSLGMSPILLGRQTLAIDRLPRAAEPCVIVAQCQHRDGRKQYADAAMFGADGTSIAYCNAIWIEVSEAQLNRGAAAGRR
jgi:hypothetical protein